MYKNLKVQGESPVYKIKHIFLYLYMHSNIPVLSLSIQYFLIVFFYMKMFHFVIV